MKRWWLRPLIRLVAALGLPVLVPLIITIFIWALPGDPASIICPPETCGGTEALAARWNLDGGPIQFFSGWVSAALQGDFGNS
jgi:ABC-type dipeptide/oligopeptide/nickel transport system permease component